MLQPETRSHVTGGTWGRAHITVCSHKAECFRVETPSPTLAVVRCCGESHVHAKFTVNKSGGAPIPTHSKATCGG